MFQDKISNGDIPFVPCSEIELYFYDEKIEYRFEISNRVFENYNGFLIVSLPFSKMHDFYKGEDFLQCRYVSNNIVYEFTGEIVRIIKDDSPCIIIKPSLEWKAFNQRKKQRIGVDIAAEYSIESGVPGLNNSAASGFCVVKDVSVDGLSFQTRDIIPINSILRMDMYSKGVVVKIQVKKLQVINEKNFYGAIMLELDNNTKVTYQKMLEKLLNEDKFDPIY